MILMHSYTYRAYSLEFALRKCGEYGYDGIELWHFGTGIRAIDIGNAIRLTKRYNTVIPVVSFGQNLIADDSSERRENIKSWKRVVRTCGNAMIALP